MKSLFGIILTIIAATLAAACGHEASPRQLRQADSLMAIKPDSAAALLRSMGADTAAWSEDAQMHYTLLCLEANEDKHNTPEADSTMQRLLAYYEQRGDRHMLPRAYYAAGKLYRNRNENTRAASYFLRTIAASQDEDNANMRSRAYSRLGYMMADATQYDEAIAMFKKSYETTSRQGDTTSAIYDLRDIARTYADKNEFDSAINIYNKALDLAARQGNHDMASKVNGQIAALYEKKGDTRLAWKYLRPALKYADQREMSPLLSIKARIYASEGRLDSAAACYNRLVSMGNVYAKHDAHTWLSGYYTKLGNMPQAIHHLETSRLYADSVAERNATESVNLQVATFDNATLRDENQKQVEQINTLTTICLILIATSITISVPLIIKPIKHRLKRAKAQNAPAPATHENAPAQPAGEPAQPASARSPEERARLEDKMRATPIYIRLRRRLDSGETSISMGTDDWNEVEAAVNGVYPDFSIKLRKLCDMNPNDYHICLLIKLGLQLKDITIIISISYQGLATARKRLYERAFHAAGGPKDWDNVVKAL